MKAKYGMPYSEFVLCI